MRSLGFAAAVSFVFISVSVALAQTAPPVREIGASDAGASPQAANVAPDAAPDALRDADGGAPPDAASTDGAIEDAAPQDAAIDDAAPQDAAPPPPDADTREPGPSDVGFSVGLHIGYKVPFGRMKDVGIHDVVSGAIPFGADIGYFFNPRLYAGVYLSYAYAISASGAASICPMDPNNSCSASMINLGIASHWHFAPKGSIDPWAGLSLGYEVLNVSELDADGTTVSSAANHGFEVGAQGGVDFKPRSFYGLGPYVELNGGHYWGGQTAVFHGWFGLGVRLRTGL